MKMDAALKADEIRDITNSYDEMQNDDQDESEEGDEFDETQQKFMEYQKAISGLEKRENKIIKVKNNAVVIDSRSENDKHLNQVNYDSGAAESDDANNKQQRRRVKRKIKAGKRN